MRSGFNAAIILLGMAIGAEAADPAERFETAVLPYIEKYCVPCHNDKSNSGGLDLKVYRNTAAFREGRDTWERILRRVDAGTMPPSRSPRPPESETAAVTAWLRDQLKARLP
jgi:hypothetical protein